jgi:replicative DNA helicase
LDDIEDLSMNKILGEIRHLIYDRYKRKLTIAAIFVDYLQAIEYNLHDVSDRRLKVRDDVFALRKMGKEFKCPVIVGVQAKQHLTGHEHKDMLIPGVYDGEETASIAQRADRVVSLWMPKMSHGIGRVLNVGGSVANVRIAPNHMFIKVNKQRGGLPSGDRWLSEIDYSTNNIKVIAKV